MKVSRDWLQTFFEEPLPDIAVLADTLTFGVAEIEAIEEKMGDTVLDVKVLPDRASYMLSHRGIAKELSVLLNIPMHDDPLAGALPDLSVTDAHTLQVTIDDEKRCPAYAAALMRGVRVGPSPEWLKKRLEVLGQRSINNVVDATNYVMLQLGTPLHAFDAKKLEDNNGIGIRVRAAKNGENITALGGEEYALDPEITVIADIHSDVPLAIAGIKGGIHAEVTSDTTEIVLEAAKFNPVRTRKSSQALKLRTDASHRFENEIADMLPRYGLVIVVKLIGEIAGGELQCYAHQESKQSAAFLVGTSVPEVNRRLGTNLSTSDVEAILHQLGLDYSLVVHPVDSVLAMIPGLRGATYKPDSAMRFDAPESFSCSSLTNYLYVHAGVAMPSISVDQYVWGAPVAQSALEPGDLVFSNTGEGKIHTQTVGWMPGTPVPEGVDHVGVYVGDGAVAHASRNPGFVVVEQLNESVMFTHVVGYRRVVARDESRICITVPLERLDLRQDVDVIEEIGRIYGYNNIAPMQLPNAPGATVVNARYALMESVRNALEGVGFIESYTYTLREQGAIALLNALASDKSHLRENLSGALTEKLSLNEQNQPLMGLDAIRTYEIGNVFTDASEESHVAVAVRFPQGKKKDANTKEALENARAALATLGVAEEVSHDDESIEWNLSAVAGPDTYPSMPRVVADTVYQSISPYPYALRDIAAWTPEGTTVEAFEEMIREQAGDTLVRIDLFDQFTKDSRTSFAFHLVFQSHEKTLSEAELTDAMNRIYGACEAAGFEIR